MVRHDQKDWINRVDLTKFTINASVSCVTQYVPFELNREYMPSMIREIHADGTIPQGIKVFANQALQNLADAHDTIIETRVFQT
jgi:ribosomal protein S3AE